MSSRTKISYAPIECPPQNAHIENLYYVNAAASSGKLSSPPSLLPLPLLVAKSLQTRAPLPLLPHPSNPFSTSKGATRPSIMADDADPSISDILASVTRAHAQSHQPFSERPSYEETQEAQRDLQDLTRAWTNERLAPELLNWPENLMGRVMRRVRGQIAAIEETTASMNSGTNFTLIVQQTELERFKFLIRSFLRCRIAKIDAHTPYYLSLTQSSQTNSTTALLSPQEQNYAHTHTTLQHRHYSSSFLSAFPAKLQRLDDRTGTSMVGEPDADKAVFVRCVGFPSSNTSAPRKKRRGGNVPAMGFGDDEDSDVDMDEIGGGEGGEEVVEVSCGFTPLRTNDREGDDEEGETRDTGGREKTVRMRRGEIWVVRWMGVREMVARGAVELV
ncbi:MAG: GINS complex subunit [Alyxoria varia]|nr:MAG: GINS complex subunit [Alyxoria varia]